MNAIRLGKNDARHPAMRLPEALLSAESAAQDLDDAGLAYHPGIDLHEAWTQALSLNTLFILNPAEAVACAESLALAIARARDAAGAFADNLCNDELTAAQRFADSLDVAHTMAMAAASALRSAASTHGKGFQEHRAVAASAIRLLAAATRFLPPTARDRYSEEFRSELSEIASAGGRRRSQLRYAIRQLVTCLSLRRELRSPRRRSASP